MWATPIEHWNWLYFKVTCLVIYSIMTGYTASKAHSHGVMKKEKKTPIMVKWELESEASLGEVLLGRFVAYPYKMCEWGFQYDHHHSVLTKEVKPSNK